MLPSPREISFPSLDAPTARPSLCFLELSFPSKKPAFPLTPPLTPASTSSDSRSTSSGVPALLCPHQEYPQCTTQSYSDHSARGSISDASLLPSPTSPTHPKVAPPRELQSDLETQPATRFLLVNGVPSSVNSQSLKQAFVACGDLKGIFVRFQADHGVIVLAFFDIRHTIRAHRQINSRLFFDNACLAARFISADGLRQLIGQSNFVNATDCDILISVSFVGPERELDGAALQNVLASFGDLRSFADTNTHASAFHAEYFDTRDATSALTSLNGRVILGVRLHLTPCDPEVSGSGAGRDTTPPLPPPNSIPFPHHPMPAPAPAPSTRARHASLSRPHTRPHTHHTHARRTSNVYKFDAVGKRAMPSTPPRPRSVSVSSEVESPVAGRLVLPCFGSSPAPLAPAPPPDALAYAEPQWPAPPLGLGLGLDLDAQPPVHFFTGPFHALPPEEVVASQEDALAYSEPAPLLGRGLGLDLDVQPQEAYAPAHFFMGPLHTPRYVVTHRTEDAARVVPQQPSKIDLEKIERGDDMRTTVMIKNIPNKMSRRNLVEFINDVCPRKIDFLYLRMDFTNECNVGYAFVNFIRVEDLLRFAKAKLGTKWNLFSSDKILGMGYATYQGKEALINKFRSSSIMDQRESWRPKLFFSSGPKQGLPEDFPSSRRKGELHQHQHQHPQPHQKALFRHG